MIGLFQSNLKSKRAVGIAVVTGSILLLLSFFYLAPRDFIDQHTPKFSSSPESKPNESTEVLPLDLPDDYISDVTDSSFCNDRFSPKYLTDLRDTTIQYCSPASQSSLTCFHSHTSKDDNRDTLCVGRGTVLDAGKFVLNCAIRQPEANETAKGLIRFERIRQYWYDTGPRYILDKYVKLDVESKAISVAQSKGQAETGLGIPPRLFTLLLKREGEGNPWHCLMEIWSMAMTIDVLRMARDPGDGNKPFFNVPEDIAKTQVVILDDRLDGPYFDLWKLFSGREPVRLKDVNQNPETAQLLTIPEQRIIIPLAGASNPMWQNDWEVRDCTHSDTLQTFVRRVLKHYNVEPAAAAPEGSDPNAIRLTFVDRGTTGTRKLKDRDALLDAVKEKFPSVEIDVVDFGALPFGDQLRVAQKTDVLVGVHGAGLTHTMFLREGVTAVVELQPSDMGGNYMGFRNLANMRNVGYFRAHANPLRRRSTKERGEAWPARAIMDDDVEYAASAVDKRASWHTEDFQMEQEAFVQLVGAAIRTLYSKNMRETDVV